MCHEHFVELRGQHFCFLKINLCVMGGWVRAYMLLALAGNGCLIPWIWNDKQAMSCPMWPRGMEHGSSGRVI